MQEFKIIYRKSFINILHTHIIYKCVKNIYQWMWNIYQCSLFINDMWYSFNVITSDFTIWHCYFFILGAPNETFLEIRYSEILRLRFFPWESCGCVTTTRSPSVALVLVNVYTSPVASLWQFTAGISVL